MQLKLFFGLGMHTLDLAKQTTLIISNKEMDDLLEIVMSLENAGLLLKYVRETIQNEATKTVDFLACF